MPLVVLAGLAAIKSISQAIRRRCGHVSVAIGLAKWN